MTSHYFGSQNLNDENIRQYLQNNLDLHIRVLSVQYNQLTDLSWIMEFKRLDTLKELDMQDNKIESFSWDDIPPLAENINLDNNRLKAIPRIGKYNGCIHVKRLDLSYNQLENIECDHIPHTVEWLYLGNNKLTSLFLTVQTTHIPFCVFQSVRKH